MRALTIAEAPKTGDCAKAIRHWATMGLTGLALGDERVVKDCVSELIAALSERAEGPQLDADCAACLRALLEVQAASTSVPDPARMMPHELPPAH